MQTNEHKEDLNTTLNLPEIQAAVDYGIDVQQLMDNLKRIPQNE